MSFLRLIYWSALIGGWGAFIGWMFSEILLHYWIQNPIVGIIMATLVAIPIGGGICLASGLTNPKWDLLIKRLVLGLAGGLLGGLLGVVVGSCMFSCLGLVGEVAFVVFLGRVIGWSFIGIGIGAGVGVSEGMLDRSFNKLRNGMIGGVLGGFLGGLFFGIVLVLAGDRFSITGRAVSFVLLGICIGLFIGLSQVLLKESWLTVEQGFRAGRQLILGKDQITMGTSEKSSLIFIAYGAKGVEPIHLKITRQEDGGYLLEDNQSRTGTLLNGQPVTQPTRLSDGDLIQFGVNAVRFNERVKHGTGERLPTPSVPAKPPAPAAPAGAIQAGTPTGAAVQIAAPKPAPAATASSAVVAAPPPPKPVPAPVMPAAAPKPAPAPPSPVEGPCPICGKKVTGIPGERRCMKCFTTF